MDQPVGDIVLGIVLASLGCAVFIASFHIPPPAFETFGAAPVPRAAAVLLVLFSVLVIARGTLGLARSNSGKRPSFDFSPLLRTGSVMAILTGHAVAISYFRLGFIAATAPALLLMFLLLGGMRISNIAISAILAILTPLAVFLVFTRIFLIDLP